MWLLMQSNYSRIFLSLVPVLFGILLLISPAWAFTAESLKIIVKTDGDATAEFDYTLEGFIENAIPESVLEEELIKGLSTSNEPPEVITFDKSEATLLLKNFAQLSDAQTGTEYLTESMDFSKAEIALKESAVSSVITADFTPHTTTVIFPDGYNQVYTDSSTLPSIRHVVIDPSKKAIMTTISTPRPIATPLVTVHSTTGGTPAAVVPVNEKTTAVPPVTTPSSGTSPLVTIIIVLGLAGAGTYYYAVRND